MRPLAEILTGGFVLILCLYLVVQMLTAMRGQAAYVGSRWRYGRAEQPVMYWAVVSVQTLFSIAGICVAIEVLARFVV